MDKWKDIELEKMKVGGNRNAREFFEDHDDYKPNMTIQQKYNTKTAALYRDKIATLAQGKSWDESKSAAKSYQSSSISSSHSSGMSHSRSSGSLPANNEYHDDDGYQNGGGASGGYQNFNSQEFKDQKETYFASLQDQNARRPE